MPYQLRIYYFSCVDAAYGVDIGGRGRLSGLRKDKGEGRVFWCRNQVAETTFAGVDLYQCINKSVWR